MLPCLEACYCRSPSSRPKPEMTDGTATAARPGQTPQPDQVLEGRNMILVAAIWQRVCSLFCLAAARMLLSTVVLYKKTDETDCKNTFIAIQRSEGRDIGQVTATSAYCPEADSAAYCSH